ncbi:hypothetical protein CRM22_010802 [Opisthorchis felineus]|uniref:Uncharacterized protein n=1 Tax=Opisthorchis felineus TaxID=147828 RepID=A0A4S2KR08_OPIFE|nr:hypothetical protein CRM22_010802 [Opisthorchis felineus]
MMMVLLMMMVMMMMMLVMMMMMMMIVMMMMMMRRMMVVAIQYTIASPPCLYRCLTVNYITSTCRSCTLRYIKSYPGNRSTCQAARLQKRSRTERSAFISI